MRKFPAFMKRARNKVPAKDQNTGDIAGYYYTAADGSQMAFWECAGPKGSKKHIHPFDEYMICVSGEYTAYIEGEPHLLRPGDELHIPKGKEQWGRCVAGTRTIHAFGGKRISPPAETEGRKSPGAGGSAPGGAAAAPGGRRLRSP